MSSKPQFKHRSSYTIGNVPGFICLVDLDQGRSITNDAEEVIADLARAEHDLTENRVLYRDTRGIWDELLVKDGVFAGFRSINETELYDAVAKAKRFPR